MSRADFEKWAKKEKHNLERGAWASPGGYTYADTHDAWIAWRAAESHTARKCEKLVREMACPYDQDRGVGQLAAIHTFDMTCVDNSKAIRAAYPDAFKEGE